MRVVRRSVQGDHPSPGRGQAIAPTMDEPGTPIRCMVGETLAFKSAPMVGTPHPTPHPLQSCFPQVSCRFI